MAETFIPYAVSADARVQALCLHTLAHAYILVCMVYVAYAGLEQQDGTQSMARLGRPGAPPPTPTDLLLTSACQGSGKETSQQQSFSCNNLCACVCLQATVIACG